MPSIHPRRAFEPSFVHPPARKKRGLARSIDADRTTKTPNQINQTCKNTYVWPKLGSINPAVSPLRPPSPSLSLFTFAGRSPANYITAGTVRTRQKRSSCARACVHTINQYTRGFLTYLSFMYQINLGGQTNRPVSSLIISYHRRVRRPPGHHTPDACVCNPDYKNATMFGETSNSPRALVVMPPPTNHPPTPPHN